MAGLLRKDQAKLLDHFPHQLPPSSAPHPSPLPSFWTKHFSSDLTRRNSTGPVPSEADIVVIGSGITGTHTAAKLVDELLAQPHTSTVRIVVLEAREFCSGATGRNGGHLTALPALHFASLAAKFGLDDALKEAKLEDLSVESVTKVIKEEGWEEDVDWVNGGNLHLFNDEESAGVIRQQLDAATSAGLDTAGFEWLTAEQTLAEVGATSYGSLRIVASANLYPAKFVTKLFQRALDRVSSARETTPVTLDLFTHAVVTGVSPSSAPFARWTVETTRGAIKTSHVIHCTNGYASSVLPFLSSSPNRIIPTRGQVLSLLPSPSSNPHWTSAFSAPHSNEYYFQRPSGGPIILGGARSSAGEPFEFGETDDSKVNKRVGETLRGYLGGQFPRWFKGKEKKGEVELEWTGVMGYRKDGVPLVGQLYEDGKALAGQFISAGYSGHGMPRAPLCGEAVALMALADLRGAKVSPPEWLPEYYISRAEGSLIDQRTKGATTAPKKEDEKSRCYIA